MIDMIIAVVIITPIHIKNNNIGKQRNDQLNKPINKGIYNASDKNVVIKHIINCVFSLQMVLLLLFECILLLLSLIQVKSFSSGC